MTWAGAAGPLLGRQRPGRFHARLNAAAGDFRPAWKGLSAPYGDGEAVVY